MEITDIARENFYVEVIAERDKMIINLFNENQKLKEEVEKLKQEKEGKDK